MFYNSIIPKVTNTFSHTDGLVIQESEDERPDVFVFIHHLSFLLILYCEKRGEERNNIESDRVRGKKSDEVCRVIMKGEWKVKEYKEREREREREEGGTSSVRFSVNARATTLPASHACACVRRVRVLREPLRMYHPIISISHSVLCLPHIIFLLYRRGRV